MSDEIHIDISWDGNDVRVEGKSADLGKDCTALTQAIEEGLGTVTKQVLKPEYHRTAARKVTVKR